MIPMCKCKQKQLRLFQIPTDALRVSASPVGGALLDDGGDDARGERALGRRGVALLQQADGSPGRPMHDVLIRTAASPASGGRQR